MVKSTPNNNNHQEHLDKHRPFAHNMQIGIGNCGELSVMDRQKLCSPQKCVPHRGRFYCLSTCIYIYFGWASFYSPRNKSSQPHIHIEQITQLPTYTTKTTTNKKELVFYISMFCKFEFKQLQCHAWEECGSIGGGLVFFFVK